MMGNRSPDATTLAYSLTTVWKRGPATGTTAKSLLKGGVSTVPPACEIVIEAPLNCTKTTALLYHRWLCQTGVGDQAPYMRG